jgi:hypothetical protein
MLCLKKRDYSLVGEYYADVFRYIEISFKKCLGIRCKSTADIEREINQIDFSLLLVNAYVNLKDYQDPVYHYLDDALLFHLESTRHKRANIYVMKS